MTTVFCTLDKAGNLAYHGATGPVRIVTVSDVGARADKLGVDTIDPDIMVESDLHAHACDLLCREIQTGRLDLVRLNNALQQEES